MTHDPYAAYIAQMLWLIASQLDALLGGSDFPVPDASTLTDRPLPADPRPDLQRRLKAEGREESFHE